MRWFVVALAGGVLSCNYVERVRGPDGDANWWTLHCVRDQGRCYALAAKQCPNGYVIADSSAASGGATATSLPTFHGEMLIKCKDNPPSADGSWSVAPAPARRVSAMCVTAFDHVRDLANAFVEANPGRDPVDDLPTRDRFFNACQALPEEMQVCLNAPYLAAHHDVCDARFDALPDRDWLVLEHLFLVADGGAREHLR